jgi:DNA-binding transcriptional LysR family regulator
MYDWNDLRHFLAVARHGSTLAAARALGLSQSTVHRRVGELEQRLGRRLVVRNPTGYKLTELGEEMVAYAARVEEAALAFERRLTASQTGLSGSVKITCPEAVGIRLMRSPLTGKFQERYENLHVEFIISDKLLDLAKGQADIAIRGTEPIDDALFGRRIADTQWAVYASQDYLRRHGPLKDASDIDRHAIALFDVELGQHTSNKWFKRVAPKARVGTRCNSITALISAAKSGVGLAALPIVVGDGENDLVRMLGPISELKTHFYLVMHRDARHAPRVKAFFDFIIENLPMVRPLLSGESASK